MLLCGGDVGVTARVLLEGGACAITHSREPVGSMEMSSLGFFLVGFIFIYLFIFWIRIFIFIFFSIFIGV